MLSPSTRDACLMAEAEKFCHPVTHITVNFKSCDAFSISTGIDAGQMRKLPLPSMLRFHMPVHPHPYACRMTSSTPDAKLPHQQAYRLINARSTPNIVRVCVRNMCYAIIYAWKCNPLLWIEWHKFCRHSTRPPLCSLGFEYNKKKTNIHPINTKSIRKIFANICIARLPDTLSDVTMYAAPPTAICS